MVLKQQHQRAGGALPASAIHEELNVFYYESQFQPSNSHHVITKEEDGERPPRPRQGAERRSPLFFEVVGFYPVGSSHRGLRIAPALIKSLPSFSKSRLDCLLFSHYQLED